jgi:hypothetical protein
MQYSGDAWNMWSTISEHSQLFWIYMELDDNGDVFSTIFLLDFGAVPTMWYFWLFISLFQQYFIYIVSFGISRQMLNLSIIAKLFPYFLAMQQSPVPSNVVSRRHPPWRRFELTTSVVIGTDCIGSCKSNYHTITATTFPSNVCVPLVSQGKCWICP